MIVELNSWGNGACPFCSKAGDCHVQETLKKTMSKLSDEDNKMELVIYTCPYFKEK